MTLEIRALDLGDRGTVDAIVLLQRASYRVEADLLGARTLPALTETPRQLRALGRGVPRRVRGRAARRRGVVEADAARSSTSTASSCTPTASAAASPARLLDALAEHEPDAERTTVATGAANPPARRLYEQRGFAPVEERVVSGSIRIVIYERLVKSRALTASWSRGGLRQRPPRRRGCAAARA